MSADRVCDLKIMRPTRYQLRSHRHVLEPTDSPQKQTFKLFQSAAERAGELCGCAGAGLQFHTMTTWRLWLWLWPRTETEQTRARYVHFPNFENIRGLVGSNLWFVENMYHFTILKICLKNIRHVFKLHSFRNFEFVDSLVASSFFKC